MYGKILAIAGSDSSGGAGIQADIKVANNLDCYIATVITALTAQNSEHIRNIHIADLDNIEAQLLAILDDIKIDIIKIGMLGDYKVAKLINELLQNKAPNIPIILDPIISSSTGYNISGNSNNRDYIIGKFFTNCSLITPNIDEAEYILSNKINDVEDMINAAKEIKNLGIKAVLLTGGHLKGDVIYDVLVDDNIVKIYNSPYIENKGTHGSGCAISTAIACNLSKGYLLDQAVANARAYVAKAISSSINPGKGEGTLGHFFCKK